MPENPSPLEDDALPAGADCTALPDAAPYTATIDRALAYIRDTIDPAFVREAEAHLEGRIAYRATNQGDSFPYSARYQDRGILLYDRLFVYPCLEDVVSTLTHELVHAVQMSRFLAGDGQPGGYNLEAPEPPWLEAEMMADGYQVLVSRELGLVSAEHARKILTLHNRRRSSLRAILERATD